MFSKLLSWFGLIKTEKAYLHRQSNASNCYEEDLSAHDDSEKLCTLKKALPGFPAFVQSYLKTIGNLPREIPCRDMLPELYMQYGRWRDAEKVIRLCISCGAYGHTEYKNSQDHKGHWVSESGDENLVSLNRRRNAASAALDFLTENPGTLQSKIYNAPVLSGIDHDALVWFCENSHQIRKEKDEETNRLYIAEKKISKVRKAAKVLAAIIALVSGLVTILGFTTGKNLPDIVYSAAQQKDSVIKHLCLFPIYENQINERWKQTLSDSVQEYNNIIQRTLDKKGGIDAGESSADNPIDDQPEVRPNAGGLSPDNPIEDPPKVGPTIIGESQYIQSLEQEIGPDFCIYSHFYNDFNDDEDCEMFAFVTTQEEAERQWESNIFEDCVSGGITGEIWFVNQEGLQKLEQEKTYWNVSGPFQVADRKFLICEGYAISNEITYLWGVNKEGNPYQPNLSGKGYGLSINNYEIELICSAYDMAYYNGFFSGHTWKPYYFYWGGTNFKEYGGNPATIDMIYSISGSDELLEQVYSELRNLDYKDIQLKEIFYRENGIININYQCKKNASDSDYNNYAATLRYENGKLIIIPGKWGLCQEGKYEFAFIPSVATSPESSFESLFGLS